MRSYKNYYTKAVLCLSILLVIFFIKPGNFLAAENGSKLDGVKAFNQNKVYEYDLNGDGKTETIQYKVIENELQHKATLKLYINKKLCLTKEDDGLSFRISILDLYKSDKYLDLFIQTTMESDCTKNAFFVQYDGKKIVNKVNFNEDKQSKYLNFYRYSLVKTDGEGKFTLLVDTPVYSKATGCYLCYVNFYLKDNIVSMVPTSTYTLAKYSKEYQYKAVKAFSAYREVGLKNIAYKVNKGNKVTFDKMYLSKTGKVYFRINNSKGNQGWISSDQENLFAELPAWG